MKHLSKPIIGLVSGIGPLAGADIFTKLLAYAATAYGAKEDADYPDCIVINHGITGVDKTAAPSSHFKDELSTIVEQLYSAGASIIGIACNTAHIYYEELPQKPGAHLVHLIDEVSKRAQKISASKLVLSSTTTRNKGLYIQYLRRHGVAFASLTEELQPTLDAAIDAVMAYRLHDAGRAIEIVLAYAASEGFEHIIAGCTELPIALRYAQQANQFTIIDANQILAETLVDRYYEELKLF